MSAYAAGISKNISAYVAGIIKNITAYAEGTIKNALAYAEKVTVSSVSSDLTGTDKRFRQIIQKSGHRNRQSR